MSLQQNIAAVRAAIDEAARRAGRDPKEVTLVAATKVQTSDTIRQAIAAGITVCGENRVQEFNAHWAGEVSGGQGQPDRVCGLGGADAGHRPESPKGGHYAGHSH